VTRGVILDRDDVNKLQDLFERVSTIERTQRRGGYGATPRGDGDSPETLLCISPTNGIPATYHSLPGQAMCEVQKVIPVGNQLKVSPAGFSILVINPGCQAVIGTQLVIATRDRFGTWLGAPVCFVPSTFTGTGTATGPIFQTGTGTPPPFRWWCVKPPGGA
jgi:hypothetical protein